MLPSCFNTPSTPPAPAHCRQQPAANTLITTTYKIQLFNDSPTLLSLTWSKTLASHSLTVHATHIFSISISLSPFPIPLFWTRPGSKSVPVSNTHNPDSSNKLKLKLYWDFTKAEFARSNSPEPDSSFYLALVWNGRVALFIGDRQAEFIRRVRSVSTIHESAESNPISRREHLFGRRSYSTTARIRNSNHEVEIECKCGTMKVRIDGKTAVVVKRLAWKFRGIERVSIGGLEVDFLWDVVNWVSADRNGGNGVFEFRIGEGGGASPEMVGPEKKLMGRCSSQAAARGMVSPSPSWSSSVLQWAEGSSDCGRSSASNSNSPGSCAGAGGGFSLVLYAWRTN